MCFENELTSGVWDARKAVSLDRSNITRTEHDDLEECGERWSVIFKLSSILNRQIYLGGFHRTSGENVIKRFKRPMLNILARRWINVSYINPHYRVSVNSSNVRSNAAPAHSLTRWFLSLFLNSIVIIS